MTDNKTPLSYATSTYVGKEFVKKFDNEDGTVTKSYKYKFKDTPEQQFGRNYWGYDTTKGAETLEEGEEYSIGYVEKPNPKGDKPMRMARFFGKPGDNTQPSAPATATTTAPASSGMSFGVRPAAKPFSENVIEQLEPFIAEIVTNKDGFKQAFGSNFDAFFTFCKQPTTPHLASNYYATHQAKHSEQEWRVAFGRVFDEIGKRIM